MLKKTHISVGTTATVMAAAVLKIKFSVIFLLTAMIGTIFSDMDHPNGAINNKILLVKNNLFKIITYGALSIALIFYGPKYLDIYVILYLVPIIIAIAFSHHRGVTHSLFGLCSIGVILYLFKLRYKVDVVIPFTLGMASHILLDMFNPQGVELLYPYKKNYRFPVTITTGGIGETILFVSFLLGGCYYIITNFIKF